MQHFFQQQFSVPVIVVGNLSVGGVGKTPLVMEIANVLVKKGLKVGLVSRGYGAKTRKFPMRVTPDSLASEVGDEPLLLAKRTGCPVVIAPNRVQAVKALLKHTPCDVVLSDDGLQHYALGRRLEIVVVDGIRGLGNGFCLPAGPLREPPARLKTSDLVVVNSGIQALTLDTGSAKKYSMSVQAKLLVNLIDGQAYTVASLGLSNSTVAAVAGIANPQRFFASLRALGLQIKEYTFADHYPFMEKDLNFSEKFVVMTEKDAVKCQKFAHKNWFYVPLEVQLEEAFLQELYTLST